MATQREQFAAALTTQSPDFGVELGIEQVQLLTDYYALVLKWNELHLVAPCTPQEFAVRHVLESLTLLKHFSLNASVVDIGSGGGLPIIPCLLVRTDLRATLIESSKRKAVFLREALRLIEPPARAHVINERFEEIGYEPVPFPWHEGREQALANLLDGEPSLGGKELESVVAPFRCLGLISSLAGRWTGFRSCCRA